MLPGNIFRNKTKKEGSRLTIMILSRLGKVREFKISSFMLFSALLFMLIYIVITLFMANGYLDLRSKCSYLDLRIEAMSDSLKTKEKSLYRCRQRVSLLNRHVDILTFEKEALKVPAVKGTKNREEGSSIEHTNPLNGPGAEISDFRSSRNGAEMTVSFKLANSIREKGPLSGYVHIVAVDENAQPHQLWSSPKVAIREGIPVDFKSGQRFSINRFKTISGTYYFDSPKTDPTLIRVFVYDRQGNLIINKSYKATMDS